MTKTHPLRPAQNGTAGSALTPRSQAEATAAMGPEADRRLIDDCLSGDASAWERMFHQHHGMLLVIIRAGLRCGTYDVDLSEEIAARVWYAVVSDGGRLLDRYDPNRGCRLNTFLAGIARAKLHEFFRAESKHHRHEAVLTHHNAAQADQPLRATLAEVSEFLETLTPREHEFCTCVLLDVERSDARFSPSNVWQLRSRIRRKLEFYLRGS